jgi:hypothetical protein
MGDDPQLPGVRMLHARLIFENIPAFGDGADLRPGIACFDSSVVLSTEGWQAVECGVW